MHYFRIIYQGGIINVEMDSEEVQVIKLKNKILSLFTSIKYDDLILSSLIDKQIFTLDDNEVIENDITFILDIENDIPETYNLD
jgi:hypothetical protein